MLIADAAIVTPEVFQWAHFIVNFGALGILGYLAIKGLPKLLDGFRQMNAEHAARLDAKDVAHAARLDAKDATHATERLEDEKRHAAERVAAKCTTPGDTVKLAVLEMHAFIEAHQGGCENYQPRGKTPGGGK